MDMDILREKIDSGVAVALDFERTIREYGLTVELIGLIRSYYGGVE